MQTSVPGTDRARVEGGIGGLKPENLVLSNTSHYLQATQGVSVSKQIKEQPPGHNNNKNNINENKTKKTPEINIKNKNVEMTLKNTYSE